MTARTVPDLNETELLFSLDKPSLRALSYVLRHKELWPRGFVWSFRHCETCAMGLACQLWQLGRLPCTKIMADHLDMDCYDAQDIFLRDCEAKEEISPEMVAGRIDRYLEGRAA